MAPGRPRPGLHLHPPLGDSREVGEHISGHHVQTRLRELQVEGLQAVISLRHGALISGPQAGTGEGRLDPARGTGHGSEGLAGLRHRPPRPSSGMQVVRTFGDHQGRWQLATASRTQRRQRPGAGQGGVRSDTKHALGSGSGRGQSNHADTQPTHAHTKIAFCPHAWPESGRGPHVWAQAVCAPHLPHGEG